MIAVFSKLSRYRDVPDVTVPDADGRVVTAKDFRPLPAVAATFRHTVDSGDRLDQLSYSYYGEPLRYWHICDANPDFLSPWAMLDQEPVVTTAFPVSAGPPWSALLDALTARVGVEAARLDERVGLVPLTQIVGGQQVVVVTRQSAVLVLVTYNSVDVDVPAIREVISSAGFVAGPAVNVGQLGKQIVIPPAVGG